MHLRMLPSGIEFHSQLDDAGLMATRIISASSLSRRLGSWRQATVGPAYQALAVGLRLLILDGRLPLAVRLPGERSLAKALGISRTTVSAAFAQLENDGFVQKHERSGALTALPSASSRGGALLTHDRERGVIDFATATMPAGPQVHAAYAKALTALPAYFPGHGYEPLGCREFREAVAERYRREGLATSCDHVMATHGAQNGLALLLRTFVRPRDRVLIDHPTYPNAIDAILAAGCRPLPVPLTPAGWDDEAIMAAMRGEAPRLAYFIADHHNPTGLLMQATTRQRLTTQAAGSDTIIVYDETMRDLWLGNEPGFPKPQDAHHIVRLGSMSKSFWGGLRIGWIRAHPDLIEKLVEARASLDLGVPILEQLAAAELLLDDGGALDARRTLLRGRCDYLLGIVRDALPSWRAHRPEGGLSLWAELPRPIATGLGDKCGKLGLHLAAGPRFGIGGAFERFIRLPFTLPEKEMARAVSILANVYRPDHSTGRSNHRNRSRDVADFY